MDNGIFGELYMVLQTTILGNNLKAFEANKEEKERMIMVRLDGVI